jgi:periplasmic protein TonB
MPSLAEPLPLPPRLSRRRSDGPQGRVARDRLITMLVLAGLLHGLIILGVSFTTPPVRGDHTNRGLEVLLVSDELPEARSNASATYLAQRTQTGSGNTRERLPAKLPSAARPEAGAAASEAQRAASQEEQLLTTSSRASRARVQMVPLPATDAMAAQQPAAAQRAGDQELRLRGETRDELYVTADTRASRLAPYLDSWRRRVERIGTVNYPSVAQRRNMGGSPVIEVALQSDGKLKSARILRTSGHPEIDAAALDILRLASPFDAFPAELAQDYRSLRFAYEWQFEGAGTAPGVVTIP